MLQEFELMNDVDGVDDQCWSSSFGRYLPLNLMLKNDLLSCSMRSWNFSMILKKHKRLVLPKLWKQKFGDIKLVLNVEEAFLIK